MNKEKFDLQCAEIFISDNFKFRIVCTLCDQYFDLDNYLEFKQHCLKFNCSLDESEKNDVTPTPFLSPSLPENLTPHEINLDENFQFNDYELNFIDLDTISLLDGNDNKLNLSSTSIIPEFTNFNSLLNFNDTTNHLNDIKYSIYNNETLISNNLPQKLMNDKSDDNSNSNSNINIIENNFPKLIQNIEKTKYPCNYCDKKYCTTRALKLHENKKHTKKLNLICKICNTKFFSVTMLRCHMKSHKNENDLNCTECKKTFLKKSLLKKHVNTEHKNECNECNKNIPTQSLLTNHKIIHIEAKSYHCNICKTNYLTKYNLENHESMEHPDLIVLECKKCKLVFPTRKILDLHVCKKKITTEKKNITEKKNQTIKTKSQHQNEKKELFIDDNSKVFNPINQDQSTFTEAQLLTLTRNETLKCGVKIVNAEEQPIFVRNLKKKDYEIPKQLMCEICGKTFRLISEYNIHKLVHLDKKPFNCPDCNKGFTRKSLLALHYRTHTGEKPYKCTECGKCFRMYSRLIVHIRSHTGERPFKCEICEKAFYAGHNLKTHVKNVHKIID